MVRVRGTDVELSLEGETAFVPGPLAIHGDELVERLGGTDVIPPGETRRFVVRFKSTTLAPHAPLRVDADVYPAGYTDGLGEDGSDPEDQGGRIGGHVRNAAGDAVAGVAVSALRANGTDHRGRFATATTRPDGSFTLDGLADGTYKVAIGSDPTNAAERKEVAIAAANRTPSTDLVAAVSEVVGSVRTPDGTRLANATVALLDADGGVVATAERRGRRVLLRRHPPGQLLAERVAPDRGLARLGDLELEAGESRTGLRLTTGSRSLAVTVNGPGSAPVAGARVIVRAPGGEPLQLAKTTNGSGVATFTGLPAGAVPVEAHRTGLGSAKAQPTGNAHTFALATAATVYGLVDSADGPVANAMVIAIAANGLTQRAFAGADGHYSFTTLAPGTYIFWFQSMGYAPERVTGVVVAPGEQTRNATLDTQGNVHPLALKSAGGGFVPGALFSVRDAASGAALVTVFAGPDGVANPGPLPAGAYLVEVSIPGSAPRTQRPHGRRGSPCPHREHHRAAADPGRRPPTSRSGSTRRSTSRRTARSGPSSRSRSSTRRTAWAGTRSASSSPGRAPPRSACTTRSSPRSARSGRRSRRGWRRTPRSARPTSSRSRSTWASPRSSARSSTCRRCWSSRARRRA